MEKVKFTKLVPEAELPTRGTEGSSGYDVKAIDNGKLVESKEGEDLYYYIEYKTGLKMELPPNYEAQARCRSSISKVAMYLCNGTGTIDSDYRGELIARFRMDAGIMKEVEEQNTGKLEANRLRPATYKKGDKIFQIVFQKVEHPEIELVEELSETKRGEGGFGSTGK